MAKVKFSKILDKQNTQRQNVLGISGSIFTSQRHKESLLQEGLCLKSEKTFLLNQLLTLMWLDYICMKDLSEFLG